MSAYVRLLPVHGLDEVEPGDDLAAALGAQADLTDGDVLVVAQKVVSKAEGRLADVERGETPAAARRRLARAEARRVVADTPWVLITETPQGHVCANGGVDASNVPDGRLALLPVDPDASARWLRAGLRAAAGVHVGVVIADTFGRPWRLGQTDIAIGVAGLAPVRDERGGVDRQGQPLEVTEAAVADELAAAADLVRRKADGVPAVVVRGLDIVTLDDGPGAAALVRSPGEDLFRRGAGQLAFELLAALASGTPRAGGAAAAGVTPDAPADASAQPVPAWLVERAIDAAAAAGVTCTRLSDAPLRVALDGEPLAAGLGAGVLMAALADGGAAVARRAPGTGEPGVVVVEAAWAPAGERS